MVVGYRAVGIAVELGKLIDIVPHALIIGVEDMRPIAVDIDALYRLGIDVACNVAALVHHQAALTRPMGLLCKHRTKQAGTHDQIIILLHNINLLYSV